MNLAPIPSRIITYSPGPIGDFLILLNMADNAHEFDGCSKTSILVSRNVEFFREITDIHYPYVDIVNLKPKTLREILRSLRALIALFFKRNAFILPMLFIGYPARIFFLGWLLTRMPKSKFLAFSRNITPGIEFAVDEKIYFDPKKLYYENLLSATDKLGWKRTLSSPRFSYTPKKPPIVAPYIVLHINASRKRHSFPTRRWIEIITLLKEQMPDIHIVLTGSRDDNETNERLASKFPSIVLNKSGGFSPSELVALIHHARLYIGVDTGISHLAAMMGQKTLIMGHGAAPTMLQTYGARAIVLRNTDICVCEGELKTDCIVEENGKRYMRCLMGITNSMINEALKKLLAADNHQ